MSDKINNFIIICGHLVFLLLIGCQFLDTSSQMRPLTNHFDAGFEVLENQGVIRVWLINISGRDVLIEIGKKISEPKINYFLQAELLSGDGWSGNGGESILRHHDDIKLKLVTSADNREPHLHTQSSYLSFDIPWGKGPDWYVSSLSIYLSCIELQQLNKVKKSKDIISILEANKQEYHMVPLSFGSLKGELESLHDSKKH